MGYNRSKTALSSRATLLTSVAVQRSTLRLSPSAVCREFEFTKCCYQGRCVAFLRPFRSSYAPSSFVIILSIFARFASRNCRAFRLAAAAAEEIPCPHLHVDRFRLEIRISRANKRPLISIPREHIRLDETATGERRGNAAGPNESILKFKVSKTDENEMGKRPFVNVQFDRKSLFRRLRSFPLSAFDCQIILHILLIRSSNCVTHKIESNAKWQPWASAIGRPGTVECEGKCKCESNEMTDYGRRSFNCN